MALYQFPYGHGVKHGQGYRRQAYHAPHGGGAYNSKESGPGIEFFLHQLVIFAFEEHLAPEIGQEMPGVEYRQHVQGVHGREQSQRPQGLG